MVLMINKKILALIPARGGSKGIPKKNIVKINGIPLLSWTINASLNSKYITKTVVSSDDIDILNCAKELGSDFIKRPTSLSLDETSSELVIEHTLSYFYKKGEIFDYLILLQPTSPLRDSIEIDNAFKIFFLNDKIDSLISVNEVDNKILKCFVENKDGTIEGIHNNKYPFMRRQELPKTYMSNGAIYIISVNSFLINKSLFTKNTKKYTMNKMKSLDIDTYDDLEIFKQIINKNYS